MAHKTNISLSIIALLLCMPAAHGMQKRKVSASSPSTAAPAAAISPYEKLEQLNSQVTSAKDRLKQKEAEFSRSFLGKAQPCAGAMATAAVLSLFPLCACPGMHQEIESAFNLPHLSTVICSPITLISSVAFLMYSDQASENATRTEKSNLDSLRDEISKIETETRTIETETRIAERNRWKEHKRRIMQAESAT